MSFSEFALAFIVLSVCMSAVMALAWVVQHKTGNTGWIDTVWTFGLGLLGASAALSIAGFDTSGRGWLIAGLMVLWALRLGLHIAHRSSSIGTDPRYEALRAEWGAHAPKRMFVLLQKQALVSIPLAVTIYLAVHNPTELWRVLDIAAVALFLAAAGGEALADHQLRVFRNSNPPRQAVCDQGLWAWSRHPNYFFQWLMWVAIAMLAIGPWLWGWMALAGPVVMYWLLTRISGVPPLEEHMLQTRGAAFEAYQKRTSPFFPIPPALFQYFVKSAGS